MIVLIVVNVDTFFISHRIEIGKAALKDGHTVHVATTLTQSRSKLEACGFTVHPIDIDRSSTGIVSLTKLFVSFLVLFWKLRPDILHLVTIKPVLIGGIAARFSPVGGILYSISGLGHIFISEGVISALRRKIVTCVYRFVLRARNIRIIVQNPDDRLSIANMGCNLSNQIIIIPGSGVNLSLYRLVPMPKGEVVVLMVARLLITKGVEDFLVSVAYLRRSGVQAKFLLAGDIDTSNPAAINRSKLVKLASESGVQLLGHRSDIVNLMEKSHIIVLPSYREGLPKVLIEAAAIGRAVVTTDVAGCRDAIEPDVTGFLVPPRNPKLLAEKIKLLIEDRSLSVSMGLAGRKRAEVLFNINAVVARHLKIYQELCQ